MGKQFLFKTDETPKQLLPDFCLISCIHERMPINATGNNVFIILPLSLFIIIKYLI